MITGNESRVELLSRSNAQREALFATEIERMLSLSESDRDLVFLVLERFIVNRRITKKTHAPEETARILDTAKQILSLSSVEYDAFTEVLEHRFCMSCAAKRKKPGEDCPCGDDGLDGVTS